jgi:hypothetical protein
LDQVFGFLAGFGSDHCIKSCRIKLFFPLDISKEVLEDEGDLFDDFLFRSDSDFLDIDEFFTVFNDLFPMNIFDNFWAPDPFGFQLLFSVARFSGLSKDDPLGKESFFYLFAKGRSKCILEFLQTIICHITI